MLQTWPQLGVSSRLGISWLLASIGYPSRGWPEGLSSALLSLILQLASLGMSLFGYCRGTKVRRPPELGGGMQTLLLWWEAEQNHTAKGIRAVTAITVPQCASALGFVNLWGSAHLQL